MNFKKIQNTENMKRVILSAAIAGGILAFWIRGIEGGISYGAGLVSFVGVFLGLYVAMKDKMISSQMTESAQEAEEAHQEMTFVQKFSMGLGISFSFLRILSYIGLIALLIVLLEWKIFDIYTYFIGIFLGLFVVVLLMIRR